MPARFVTTGVGSRPSEDEHALAPVWCPGVSGGYDLPLRIEPDVGQVPENSAECSQSMFVSALSQTPRARFHVAIGSGTEKPPHVLKQDESRLQHVDRRGDPRPHAGAGAGPQALPCPGAAHVLAGEACGEHVHRRHGQPVDCRDVPEVRDAGEPRGEDRRSAGVGVRDPCELAAEDGVNGHVQAGVAGAERTDLHAGHPLSSDLKPRTEFKVSDNGPISYSG
jgi:hypothetical protein